jgi:hypothetical protein
MKRDGPISDLQGTNPSHSVIEKGLNNLDLLNREVVILIPAYIYIYCVYIYMWDQLINWLGLLSLSTIGVLIPSENIST